jgi:hypothetical protein
MTKRDFVLIAEIVKSVAEGGALCMDDASDRVALAEEFAAGLSLSNPRFDRARFVEAATFEQDRIDAAEETEVNG